MTDYATACSLVLLLLCIALQSQFPTCSSFLVSQSTRNRYAHVLLEGGSDFMGDIARDRITIKSLAKLSTTSSSEKKTLDQFIPTSNFEVITNDMSEVPI